jgi:hypothetical protein
MKNEDPGIVRPARLHIRRLLVCGVLLAMGALVGMALHTGGGSNPPSRASITPPAAAQRPVPPGVVVSHSAHYTLTAEIHAGS